MPTKKPIDPRTTNHVVPPKPRAARAITARKPAVENVQHIVPRLSINHRDGLLYVHSIELSMDKPQPPVELILSRDEAAAFIGNMAKVLAHAWESE